MVRYRWRQTQTDRDVLHDYTDDHPAKNFYSRDKIGKHNVPIVIFEKNYAHIWKTENINRAKHNSGMKYGVKETFSNEVF